MRRHPNQVRIQVSRGGDAGLSQANGIQLTDRLVLTCAHLIDRAVDAPWLAPDDLDIKVTFDLERGSSDPMTASSPEAGWFPILEAAGLSDLVILELAAPRAPQPIRLRDESFPGSERLYGSPWDYERPGFVDLPNIRTKDDDFIADAGPLVLLIDDERKLYTQPGHSGFPIFDEDGALAALHQKANREEYPRHELIAASVPMIWAALEAYAAKGGQYPIPERLSVEPPEIDDRGRVMRRSEYEATVAALLAKTPDDTNVTAITSLSGDGGFGKTTLADMVRQNARIRKAFGALNTWTTIGRDPGDIVGTYSDLASDIDPDSPRFDTEEKARDGLAKVLAGRKGLIVVDDVWDDRYLEPFRAAGPDLRILVTTRRKTIAAEAGAVIEVDEMGEDDAVRLLARNLAVAKDAERAALMAFARKLHLCAQLLEAANALLLRRRAGGSDLVAAIEKLEADLAKAGFRFWSYAHGFTGKIDEDDPEARAKAVAATIKVALNELPEEALAAYRSLCVLPEDETVPEAVIEAYWEHTPANLRGVGGAILDGLVDLHLVQQPPGFGGIRLHDMKRNWLLSEATDTERTALHARMAETLVILQSADDPVASRYAWRQEIPHLREAGQDDTANTRLTDYNWIEAKLNAVGIDELRKDHETQTAKPERRNQDAELIGQIIIWDAQILRQEPKALPALLLGRVEDDQANLVTIVGAKALLGRRGITQVRKGWRTIASGCVVLEGHSKRVTSAAFSPDGSVVLSASQDGTARLWSPYGAPGPVLEHHGSWAMAPVFSADGAMVLTRSSDGSALLWSARDGVPGPILEEPGCEMWSAVFSPDGAKVLTRSSSRTVQLWSARDGAPGPVLDRRHIHGGAVAFSPNGSQVLTASGFNAQLWSALDGAPGPVLKGHRSYVNSASFSPDGTLVLTASSDGTARLWSAHDGAPGAVLEHFGGLSYVWSPIFSPDGALVLTAVVDKAKHRWTAQFWSAQCGAPGSVLEHENSWMAPVFSPDSAVVLTSSFDGGAQLWSAQDGAPGPNLASYNDELRSALFSPDGSLVITTSNDATARLWAAQDGSPGPVLEGHGGKVHSAVFDPDGARVLTASEDGTARLWSARRGPLGAPLEGHGGAVTSAVFGPDGLQVLTASIDGTARLWSARDGSPGPVLKGHGRSGRNEAPDHFMDELRRVVRSAVFCPDGSQVLTASQDGTARLWTARDGTPGPVLKGSGAFVDIAVFSPDGALVLTASRDNSARLWSARNGAPGPVLKGHGDRIMSAVFSPDGSVVLTASADGTARLWSAKDGTPGSVLNGNGEAMMSAVFSPDGTNVLTGCADGSARLWSIRSGAPGTVLVGHVHGVISVAFSPDGAIVLTASADGTARLWSARDGAAGPILEGHSDFVKNAVFSPDGGLVLTGSDDGTARWWRVGDGTELAMMPCSKRVTAVAVSATHFALGDAGGGVHIFAVDWEKLRRSV